MVATDQQRAPLPSTSGLELAAGVVLGGDAHAPPLPRLHPGSHPRGALEGVLRRCLARQPCVVSFSGGRDSSAVLALAADVARHDGLPLPVPVTIRFSGVPEAEESTWQELVVRHLGLPDWECIEVSDELDLLGPGGRRVLLAFGPHSPEQLHFDLPLLAVSRGGSLVTGEGGDDLFDERRLALARYRWARWRAERRSADLKAAGIALAPVALRRRLGPGRVVNSGTGGFEWLQPEARQALLAQLAGHVASEPLRWRAFVPWLASRRAIRLPAAYFDALAASQDVHRSDPLLDPTTLAALRDARRGWGWPDRTAALAVLVGDLLPDVVLRRRSKAAFGGGAFREASRRFAESWDGQGLDASIVDAERLRHAWLAPEPDARTHSLLRAAWWSRRTRQGLT
jgi:Asparagine synthase